MVSIITCCLKKQRPLLVTLVILSGSAHANIFDDAFSAIKSAANTVGDAFTTAGKEIEKGANIAIGAIKERFSDTKTTRAIDYGVRKAALEAALATANGVLEGAKQASAGTLIAAEETAKAGLTAAEHFLSDVVRVASPAILKGSAQTAQGVLEGVKQAGVGVLQGTQWVVTTATSTFDINRIRYQGDLKRLKTGVLGDMLCEGTAFKHAFSFTFDLDPRDMKSIGNSIEKLLKDFERLFNENVANPIKNAFVPLKQQAEQAEKILTTQAAPPKAVTDAIDAAKKATAITQNLAQKEQEAATKLYDAVKKLQEIAQKNNKELESLIRQGTQTSSVDSALARQELIKRLKNKPR